MVIQDKAPVNWVKQRASCTINDLFQALLSRLKADIEEKREVHPDSEFTVKRKVAGDVLEKVAILGPKHLGLTPIVELKKEGATIKVHGTEGEMFVVMPKWDQETAECLLLIDDKPLDLWQISQRALYPLFFRD